MSASGLHDLTAILFGFIASIATGPVGGLDIPEGDLAEILRRPPPGYEATLQNAAGDPIGQLSTRAAIPVDLARIPQVFFGAVLAAEDHRFMNHDGVDPFGLMAAAASTLSGGTVRGGSTITQQMIKNRILTNDRTLERKLLEAILALRAQHAVGRDGVMKAYLESAWFGRGQTGVMLAPQTWFGVSWDDLDLAQAAMLAAMLKGPATYDPEIYPERALERRNAVIQRMVDLGWISPVDGAVAQATDLVVVPAAQDTMDDAWVAARTRRDMDAMLATGDYRRDHLTVQTSIDSDWQDIAETALRDGVRRLTRFTALGHLDDAIVTTLRRAVDDPDLPAGTAMRALLGVPTGPGAQAALYISKGKAIILSAGRPQMIDAGMPGGYDPKSGDVLALKRDGDAAILVAKPRIQGAVVVMDPRTGEVLASVGGYDQAVSAYDRTTAQRQPGSAIKPFLYLAALDLGYQATDLIANSRETFVDEDGVSWTPSNYDHSAGEPIPMWMALEQSANLAAAHLIDEVGPISLARVAEAAGVYDRGEMGLRLTAALGAYETTLSDLVAGYGAIVNGGFPRPSHSLTRISDDQGQTGVAPRPSAAPIAGAYPVADVLSMMRGVVVRGTAAQAMRATKVRMAGKTGTTQDNRDAWFVGVSPHLVVGVWIGRDDNTGMGSAVAGGTAAAPVAAAILTAALNAGLIDEDGYRDDRLTSGLSWPPALFERGGGGAVVVNGLPQIASGDGQDDGGFILEMTPAPRDADTRYYDQGTSDASAARTPIVQPGLSYFNQ